MTIFDQKVLAEIKKNDFTDIPRIVVALFPKVYGGEFLKVVARVRASVKRLETEGLVSYSRGGGSGRFQGVVRAKSN